MTVVKDSASSAASANGKDLVVISDSVAPGKVGSKFSLVSIPVIAYEHAVYDDLGLTGPVSGTDFGRTGETQTQLRMTGSHPLTALLSGVVTVGTEAARFSWGKPGAAAVIAATLKGSSLRPTIFAYEAGAQLANGMFAPARRVAIHPNAGAMNAWNANGQDLFGVAVQWALGETLPAGAVRILPLGDSITKGRTRIGRTAGTWKRRWPPPIARSTSSASRTAPTPVRARPSLTGITRDTRATGRTRSLLDS